MFLYSLNVLRVLWAALFYQSPEASSGGQLWLKFKDNIPWVGWNAATGIPGLFHRSTIDQKVPL